MLKDLDEERRRIIEEQNRKIFHPPSIEGLDLGDRLETLDPEIRIPTEEEFILPPPLERYKLVCRSKRSKSSIFDKSTF